MKRLTWLAGAALLAFAGCAHENKATVTQEDLARVPPADLQRVNQQRMEVATAQDQASREKIVLNEAQNELSVAQNEEKVAKAEIDRAKSEADSAKYARDNSRSTHADQELMQADQHLQLAQLHEKAAQSRIDYAKARIEASDRRVDLANAQLEQEKFNALRQSGDPAVKNHAPGEFDQAVRSAQTNLQRAEGNAAQQKAMWEQARSMYVQQQSRLGVGGAGKAGAGHEEVPLQQPVNKNPASDDQMKKNAPDRDANPGIQQPPNTEENNTSG
jgi:colicin import membrane protein